MKKILTIFALKQPNVLEERYFRVIKIFENIIHKDSFTLIFK